MSVCLGIGALVICVLVWAHFADKRAVQRARRQDEELAARAFRDLAAAPLPRALLAPTPRTLTTRDGDQSESDAALNRALQHGPVARGVILEVYNTTDEDGVGPDVVRFAYRDPTGVMQIRTHQGNSWLYGLRPEWCRVRRPIAVLLDDTSGAAFIFEEHRNRVLSNDVAPE